MKYFAIASLSLLLSLAPPRSVTAIDRPSHEATIASTNNPSLTPFQLVALAYQGTYRPQGIPGFAGLISAYHFRTITAQDVIAAAIAAKELTPAVLTDRDYVSAVDLQLFSLDRPD
jgi:hypothetical protein